MKNLYLSFLFFLISLSFIYELNAAEVKFVSTKAGLHLRSSPDKSSNILTLIPFGKDVSIINYDKKEFFMDGRYGSWVNIKYDNKTGWVFGGFLCNFKPDTIIKQAADYYRKKYREDKYKSEYDDYTDFKDNQVSIVTIIDNYILLEVPLSEMDNEQIAEGNVIWKYNAVLNQFTEVYNIGHQNRINLFFLDDDKLPDFIITYGCCSWVQADIFIGTINGFSKISEIKDCDGRYFTEKIENCDKMIISCSEDSKENIHYKFNCKKRNVEIYAKGKIVKDIGVISEINLSTKKISINVEFDNREKVFTAFEYLNIGGFTPEKNSLSDLVVGDKIEFDYEDIDGKYIILSIFKQDDRSRKILDEKIKEAGMLYLQNVKNGNIEEVKKYLESNRDADFKDPYGWTALMVASQYGNIDLIKLLLSKNIDLNLQTIEGHTALMIAANKGHVEIVKLLLYNKADFTLKDKKGNTALTWARLAKNNEIILLLENTKNK